MSNMNTYIYIHVCCINNWKEIFGKLLSDIRTSGLYDKITKIRVNILTDASDLDIFNDAKIEILGISKNLNAYENSTLNLLYEHSLKEEFKVLYLHTKGIKFNGKNLNVTDWVRYMSYFNIDKHSQALDDLDKYDAVGVNLNTEPVLHFSGNFWWSKSDHIRKLGNCKYENYNSPEFWVTCVKGDYKELWKSGINHYYGRYEESRYR
jgi:hypothetical protein